MNDAFLSKMCIRDRGTAVLSVSKAVADADIQKAVEDKDYKLSLIHISHVEEGKLWRKYYGIVLQRHDSRLLQAGAGTLAP